LLYHPKASVQAGPSDISLLRNVDNLTKPQDGPTSVRQSHEQYADDDAEMEEILSHRAHHASTPIFLQSSGHIAGSNSVLFPDSRTTRAHDSPSSSVNADVVSHFISYERVTRVPN
jgi:hypothetical protein